MHTMKRFPLLLTALTTLSVSIVGCDSDDDEPEVSIETSPGSGVTDADGNTYATIVLGNGQEWMAENLRTTSYANGDAIAEVGGTSWSGLSTGAYCWHSSNADSSVIFGLLYNFHTVADDRNVCPDGWHVPSVDEWNSLIAYIDPTAQLDTNPQSTVAGARMKSTDSDHWQEPNNEANNLSGFSGVGAGFRSNDGSFYSFRQFGYWWTSTENTTTTARNRSLYYGNGQLGSYISNRRSGLSVRCLKD